jgi:hypothetical protein
MSLFLDDADEPAAPYIFSTGPGMLMAASSMICDIWDSEDRADALFVATCVYSASLRPGPYLSSFGSPSARHTLAPSGLFTVRSNATNEVVPLPGGMNNLTVAVNDDASEKQAVFIVTLTSSSIELRDQTYVCFSQANQTRGLSLYVRPPVTSFAAPLTTVLQLPQHDLAPTDVLAFDIRLLFPQNAVLFSSDLITYLPMFNQAFAKFDPRIQFRKINVVGAGVDIICDVRILCRIFFLPFELASESTRGHNRC